MKARDQLPTGGLKIRIGRSSSRAVLRITRFASITAAPVRGMIGENQKWPLVGFGLVSERAPM